MLFGRFKIPVTPGFIRQDLDVGLVSMLNLVLGCFDYIYEQEILINWVFGLIYIHFAITRNIL